MDLDWKDPLVKVMVTYSSISWKVPWTEEPGRLTKRGHKESDKIEHTHTHIHSLLNGGAKMNLTIYD